ncbi:MAG: DNA cytosine methyltransferase [Promethearchaeota archaeon]
MKILDLYAGLGGTAKGIQKALAEFAIDYEYFAVDNNHNICIAHKQNNPSSQIICDNALNWLKYINKFDFIWASPPCQSHSKLQYIHKNRLIDWSLWHIIDVLRRKNIPYVVENVLVYYNEPFEHTLMVGRHCFWSNIKLVPFEYKKCPKKLLKMTNKELIEYHSILPAKKTFRTDRQLKNKQTLDDYLKGDENGCRNSSK